MKTVKATNCEEYFVIDEEDADLLVGRSWSIINGYVSCSSKVSDGLPRRRLFLHRLIAKPQKGQVVDHADGDKLNNLRSNLRCCSHSDNIRNSKKSRASASRYKGVSRTAEGKWMASCGPRNTNRYIGVYSTELEAAKVYDEHAFTMYGDFANLNFPRLKRDD